MIPQEYEEQDPDHYPENAPPPSPQPAINHINMINIVS